MKSFFGCRSVPASPVDRCKRRGLAGLVLLALLFSILPARAEKTVRLAAAEQPPYVGQALVGQGYVAELVRAAFKQAGYTVELRFYPAARARSLAASGQVDGFLPASRDASLEAAFSLSAPFPGANFGLLKKRGLEIDYPPDAPQHREEILRALGKYRFGSVRDAAIAPEYDKADYLRKDYVAQDLQNLDKLALGRLDLMVVDKYAASDLMIMQRPHLIGLLDFLNPPLFRSDFHVAFSRQSAGYQERQADFDRGLAELKSQGAVDELLLRHGLRGSGRNMELGQGVQTLTIGTVDNPDMLVMRSLGGEFEKQNPGIRLAWRFLEEDTLRTRLMTDIAIADGQFDVMTIGAYETPIWAARGWLTALDDLPPSYDADDLLPTVRDSLSYRNRLYALPFYGESLMTYYRTDLFKRAGVSMPERPSWSDIKRLAAITHDPAHGTYGVCLRGKVGWGANMALIGAMINTFGGRWFDEKWQPEIDSDAWRRAVGMYVELLSRYGPPNSIANNFNENLTLFAEGHCAIWVDATVAAGFLYNPKTSRVAGDLGFAPAPRERAAGGANWLWAWALAVPETSPRKAAALRFIEWATSRAYVRTVARQRGWVAVPPGTRQSTYASPEYQAAAPFSGSVREAIASAEVPTQPPRPYTGVQFVGIPEFPAIGYQVGSEISRAVSGSVSVEQALRNAQATVLRQMEASGYIKRDDGPQETAPPGR